jgi:hypothetical protein
MLTSITPVVRSGGLWLEMGFVGDFSALRIFAVGYLCFHAGSFASPQSACGCWE